MCKQASYNAGMTLQKDRSQKPMPGPAPDGARRTNPKPEGASRSGWRALLTWRWLLLGFAVAGFALTELARRNPDWTETVFSRGVYPALSSAVAFLPSLLPFSVAEWFVVAVMLGVAVYLALSVRSILRARPGAKGHALVKAVAGLLGIASVLYFAFVMLCGANYYRHTFAEQSGLEIRESSTEELTQLCEGLAADMTQARSQLEEAMAAEGVATLDEYAAAHGGFAAYADGAVGAVSALASRYPAFDRPLFSPPKPVLASTLMSYADIAGIYFPFTVESNINTSGPFFPLPATMAHELAHQAGFMREDEANFIAYLACTNADDALMRYSGYSLAYDYAISALRKVDPEKAAAISATLSDAVKADRQERSRFLAQFEGPVAQMSNAANNAYLQANNQTDGTRSYGRMVDLLLAEARGESLSDELLQE